MDDIFPQGIVFFYPCRIRRRQSIMKETRKTINRLYLPDNSLTGLEVFGNNALIYESSIMHDKCEKYQYRYLEDAELLAALSGIKLEQAVEILRQYRLHEIEDYLDGLTPKLTERQKRLVLSAFELSRRVFRRTPEKQHLIRSPQELVAYLEADMRYLKKEIFVCVHLNTKNVVLRKETISIGSLNASIVHPREVFSNAVKHSVSSVILCHNHPSGDPQASPEDIDTTKRLVDAGNILGIKVLDHVIIGDGSYISLKESGLM